jgi:hypothetical protein
MPGQRGEAAVQGSATILTRVYSSQFTDLRVVLLPSPRIVVTNLVVHSTDALPGGAFYLRRAALAP